MPLGVKNHDAKKYAQFSKSNEWCNLRTLYYHLKPDKTLTAVMLHSRMTDIP